MIQSELIDRMSEDIRKIKSVDDLNFLSAKMKSQRKYLGREIGDALKRGDKVKVANGSKTEYGEIIKVNISRAVVRINSQQWNVPFSMITKTKEIF